MGFAYKKPVSLPARADEAEQKAFIADYEALMTGQGGDEMVVFSGAVHPSTPKSPHTLIDGMSAANSQTPKKRPDKSLIGVPATGR